MASLQAWKSNGGLMARVEASATGAPEGSDCDVKRARAVAVAPSPTVRDAWSNGRKGYPMVGVGGERWEDESGSGRWTMLGERGGFSTYRMECADVERVWV